MYIIHFYSQIAPALLRQYVPKVLGNIPKTLIFYQRILAIQENKNNFDISEVIRGKSSQGDLPKVLVSCF